MCVIRATILLLITWTLFGVATANVHIELPYGVLRGKDQGYYYSYESIPYAEPPVGELRFEAPVAYQHTWDGVFDATEKPVPCLQWDQFSPTTDRLTGNEDCLTVNIYKPKSTNSTAKFPVLVLLHGGAFMFGSADAVQHDYFMRSGRIIIVKISFRLGPLGFLSTEDTVIPGNFGLKDQRLALQWIKQHIAQFGGDPTSILLLGFSAGGSSVHFHMLQPNFAEYAKAAISMSGTALNPWVVMHNARSRAYALAQMLNCKNVDSSEEIKKCLKQKQASDIVRAVRHFLIFGYNPFTTFGPVIESPNVNDALISQSPDDAMRSGKLAAVPWLVSCTTEEGGYNAAELLQKTPQGNELIEMLNDRWNELAPYTLFYKDTMSSIEEVDNHSKALKQHYLGNDTFSVDSYHKVQRMYSDVLFKNGLQQTVLLASKYARSPVYAYSYSNPADRGSGTYLAERTDIPFGTTHGDDYFLIFPNVVRNKELRPDESIISRNFIKMLEDFAQNSNELIYDSCKFVDNVGNSELQLMSIKRGSCMNLSSSRFP